jgi:predicted transcriptional regulator
MERTEPKIITTVTLSPALRVRLDQAAAAQDRSRSWVAATAIREWLDRQAAQQTESAR